MVYDVHPTSPETDPIQGDSSATTNNSANHIQGDLSEARVNVTYPVREACTFYSSPVSLPVCKYSTHAWIVTDVKSVSKACFPILPFVNFAEKLIKIPTAEL